MSAKLKCKRREPDCPRIAAMPHAVILSIGDEIVLGQTVDTNSAWLSDQLVRMGIGTLYHQSVADDTAAISAALRMAGSAADLVLVSGGLGPTDDDLTRPALAEAMGVTLAEDGPSLAAIRAFFAGRGRSMPERNRVQALCPVGAAVLPNGCGTAPGLRAGLGRAEVFVMPGVPREMKAMFEGSVRPALARLLPERGVILTAKVNTFGLGESTVGELLGELMDRRRNPKVGTTVAGGVVSVRVRSEFEAPDRARSEMEDTLDRVERALKPYVYGRDDSTLGEALVALLGERGLRLCTAESCTGGLLARLITDTPGSSRVFRGGWVTYHNELKAGQLGVPTELLQRHGAVSGEVARAMALGALERGGAEVGVSVTGIAGPEGGTAEKPVGTVWVSVARRVRRDETTGGRSGSEGSGVETVVMRLLLPGEREMVRDRAAKCAIQLVRFLVMGVGPEAMGWGEVVRLS